LTQIQTYTGFDITESQTKPNVIGISEHLPFASEYFDSVLCTQVLEHVARPWLALQEIGRVLRKDGLLLLSAPKSWRLHEEPYDYYRYTKYGLSFLLQQSNLQIIHMKPQGGVWTNIGASIINTVWRKPARKYWPTWLIRMVFTVALNATFASADRIWLDEDDTYNYVVLAKKVSLPK
jgi:SAM-dependent methyltransferase